MKTRRALSLLGCVLGAASMLASEPSPAQDVAATPSYVFVPGCCIRSMTPVTAVVTHRHFDRAFLKSETGQKITIGGFGATPDVIRFIATLKENTNYRFPEVFLDHEKAMRGETFEAVDLSGKVIAKSVTTDGGQPDGR